MTSTHSIYKEFDEQLKTMIGTYANNNPAPRFAKIENVSPDEKYVDVSIGEGVIKAVERFGSKPVVGTKCILVFMNGNYEEPVAICNEYIEETLCYNLLNNGCFQKVTTSGFEDWTGGTISTLNYYYNQSTARLLPETSMTSSTINITSLEDKELGEVSEIMLFYFYIGSITIEVIDKDTGEPVTFAPENLGNKKEILEPVDSWHYARTHFLLRKHKNVAVKFTNPSKTQSAYLDGVRLWKPDFGYWYPSEKDEYEIGNMLNKNYFTILKDPASWKTGVNKIIHDIDSRLKNLENSSGGDGGSSEHTHNEYATKDELNNTNSIVDEINNNYVSHNQLDDTLESFASAEHTHDDYLTYNDTISNSEKINNKTYGDLREEFASKNHEHQHTCYVKPFIVDNGESVVYLPIFTDEQSMFVLDINGEGFSTTAEFEDENTVVTIDGGTSGNMYYLFYWTPQA